MSNRRTVLRNSAAVAFGATAVGAFISDPAEAQTRQQSRSANSQQRAEIVAVLRSYQRALNASDVAAVVRLYTADAVLMAPNAPAAIGADAVRAAYTGIFQAIDIDLTFDVAEVNVVSADWAFLQAPHMDPSSSSPTARRARAATRSCSYCKGFKVVGSSPATASRRSCPRRSEPRTTTLANTTTAPPPRSLP